MSSAKTQAIPVRLTQDKLRRLDDLAAATDRPRDWHIEQALDAYLEVQAWQLGHIEAGLAALDDGRTVPHDKVRDWLSSWGREDEREPPT